MRTTPTDKHKRRVIVFFAALALTCIILIAHGFYTGELKFSTDKACITDDCGTYE